MVKESKRGFVEEDMDASDVKDWEDWDLLVHGPSWAIKPGAVVLKGPGNKAVRHWPAGWSKKRRAAALKEILERERKEREAEDPWDWF